jgi:citrate lyase subunit beta/citryl-CoA lyase
MTKLAAPSKSRLFRSWMFVPGNRDRFVQKAKAAAADGILLDIEDGVLPAEKEQARRAVAVALSEKWSSPAARYVRVNALSTPWLVPDLDAVIVPGIEGICLTKVVTADDILNVSSQIEKLERERGIEPGSVRILAALESALGLINAYSVATAHPRISGLIFGAEDYALDLGLGALRVKEAAELIYARSAVVVAATAAQILSVDGVFPDLNNPEGLLEDVRQARRLGFTSKSTFNPRQIDLINEEFSPKPEEIEYARKIAEGFREAEARGDASVAVNGQLVDRPIVLRALRMLEAIGER